MKFAVNNQEWELVFVKPSSKHLMRSDGSITIGMTDNNTKTIYINNRLSDAMFDKVLLHELSHVHAMEYNYSIPIEVEEIVCDFLSLYGRSVVDIADDLLRRFMRVAG